MCNMSMTFSSVLFSFETPACQHLVHITAKVLTTKAGLTFSDPAAEKTAPSDGAYHHQTSVPLSARRIVLV